MVQRRNQIVCVGDDRSWWPQLFNISDFISPVDDPTQSVVWPWIMETKYYRVSLEICAYAPTTVWKGEQMDALVLLVDEPNARYQEMLEQGARWLEQWAPSIAICVCRQTHGSSTALMEECREQAFNAGFEWIALDEADVMDELVGKERFTEALQSHLWEGLVRLDARKREQTSKGEADPQLAQLFSRAFQTAQHDSQDAAERETEEQDFESWGLLMQKLQGMRDEATRLPHEERHQMAASVALAMAKCFNVEDDD